MQVKDVLSFGGLVNARVAAGRGGLEAIVESVSVLEIAEESISTWTLHNQLFITSFYATRNDVEMQKLIVQTLSKCGCCGLVLCHIDYVLHTLDLDLLKLCDQLEFPLIVADTDVSFVEILNPIFSRLSHPAQPTGVSTIRSDFADLLTRDISLSETMKIMAYNLGCTISFLDVNMNYLYSNKGDIKKMQETAYLKEHIQHSVRDLSRLHYVIMEPEQVNDRPTMLYYVKKSGSLFGFLSIDFQPGDTEEKVLAMADSLNLPCAMLLNKAKKMSHLEADYRQSFFTDLLVWNFRSTESALQRAEEFGYHLRGIHAAMVINLNDIPERQSENRELINYICTWYQPNVEQIIHSYSKDNILHFRSDTFIVLVTKPVQLEQLREMAGRILQLFTIGKTTSVSIGISTSRHQFTEIPQAYNEAFDIAILGRTLLGVNQVADFFRLGLFYYMRSMRTTPHIVALCHSILAPLQAIDESKHTELVKTAWALFRCNLDVSRSAGLLHIHRNTLLYRKKQIQDIMGYDPFSQPYCCNFIIALFLLHQP